MLRTLAILAVLAVAEALRAPVALRSGVHVRPQRSAAALMSASAWETLDGSASRAATVAALDQLKEEGAAPLWGTFKLAPRPVTLQELTQVTKVTEKMLDPSADLSDVQDTFIKVLVGSSVLAFAWGAAFNGVGDGTIAFTGAYLIGGVPIAVLAIGSLAPGLLALPFEALKKMGPEYRERICRHEAAHLLTAYLLGCPVSAVVVNGDKPCVEVYDEASVQTPGTTVASEQLPPLAVIAMSGMMAEADLYGNVLGASADLLLLNNLLQRCRPPIPAQEQQSTTRWASLMAWTMIKKYERAYEALYQELLAGSDLATCLRKAEAAEAA